MIPSDLVSLEECSKGGRTVRKKERIAINGAEGSGGVEHSHLQLSEVLNYYYTDMWE